MNENTIGGHINNEGTNSPRIPTQPNLFKYNNEKM